MTNEPGERLESWKKIAAYLKRDVRTVQRWEETHGLPIHRHKRTHRSIPYAYTAELDAWWSAQSEPPAEVTSPRKPGFLVAAVALSVLVIAGAWGVFQLLHERGPSIPAKSIAVLPFIDLSEGMVNEEFADGVTEELIARLGKIPGVRVPAPTSTFFYKNKQVPVPEIGRSLGVAYVLDGSVRKSGERVRIAARLIRADNEDVVWSESYERQWSDILAVQDDIANEVTEALQRETL